MIVGFLLLTNNVVCATFARPLLFYRGGAS